MSESEVAKAATKDSTTLSPRRKRRRWLMVLMACGFSGCLLFLVLEVGLRLAHITYPPLYTADEYVGTKLRPGAWGWWRKEGHAWFKIAAHGFRDRPRSVTPTKGTYRIAVLGDSYIEGLQVELNESFTQQLEQRLNGKQYMGSDTVEVLNFGVSGYGTAQELMMLRHHVWQYQPNGIILAIYPGNDIRNNSKALEPVDVRPYFTLENQELVLDESFKKTPEYQRATSSFDMVENFIFKHCVTFQYLKELKQRLESGRPDAIVQQDTRTRLSQTVAASPYVYQAPQTPQAVNAWEVTEALLREIKRECEQHEATLSLMVVSDAIEVFPNPKIRKEVLSEHKIENVHYAADRINAWCEIEEIPCWVTSKELQDHVDQGTIYLHGFENTTWGLGHWNATGHKLAAETVATGLLDR